MTEYAAAAIVPAAGAVRTQPTAMSPATDHRTADRRVVAPTPITAEVTTCVVDTGAANTNAVRYSTELADSSAAKPCGGVRLKIRRPSVRMIRSPPDQVPAASAVAHSRITQSGTV